MGKPEKVPPLPHSKKLKYLTTSAILLGNITFGCAFNYIAPALEDLRKKYGSTLDEISVVFTVLLVAYCFGALTSGIIYNFLNRQLGVIFWLGGMATAVCLIPHLPSKTLFFVVAFLLGFSAGAYDAAQIVWILEFWQSNAGPVIQSQHFFYALGSNIPPMLLGPFLSKESNEDSNTSVTSTTESSTLAGEVEESKIYIPYTIAAGFSAMACCYQIFLFTFYRYYKPPLEEDLTPKDLETSMSSSSSKEDVTTADQHTDSKSDLTAGADETKPTSSINWPKVRIIALSTLFLAAYQGMEMCTMQFIPTFGQYSDLKLSESDSAFVLTGLTAAFAVGRFIGIFAILKIIPQFMLVVNLVLILGGNLILLIWASSNLTMFWIGCIVLGAGFSTMYASFFAFIEKHLVFTNAIGGFTLVVGSATAATYPLIVGSAIEDNPVVLTYTNFLSICACSLALAGSSYLTYGNTKRVG